LCSTAFLYYLDRNLENVDGFYNRKFGEIARRLRLLRDRYGPQMHMPDGIDKDDRDELMGALIELRAQLRNLQWYGEVNRRGFVKITKKLDKKIPQTSTQRQYLTTRVDPKPFATMFQLLNDKKAVNEWMSKLGEMKVFDDVTSVNSSTSLRTAGARALLNLPQSILDAVEQAVRNDDPQALQESLKDAMANEESHAAGYQQLLLNFLQRSITCRSKKCLDPLLSQIKSLEAEDDINDRNCLHRLVIAISRTKAAEAREGKETSDDQYPPNRYSFVTPAAPPAHVAHRYSKNGANGSSDLLSKEDESVVFLVDLMDKLRPEQRSALKARDSYGRFPLHYAAQYGFVAICEVIIKHMQDWGQFEVKDGIDSVEWQDSEGFAPLHLAVTGGHTLTTKALLDAENWQGQPEDRLDKRKYISKTGEVLALAAKADSVDIVKLLVKAGVDINYKDEQGETALHLAARYNHLESCKALVEGSPTQATELDVPDRTFGWTPLFVGAVDGHLSIVELLIEVGADTKRADYSGFTAAEHAALRGHIEIAQRLQAVAPPPESPLSPPSDSQIPNSPSGPSPLEERKSKVISKDNSQGRSPDSVKTFGHRYLTDETLVLVSLGTMDTRKSMDAISLDDIPLAHAHNTQLDTALSIVVSATGAKGDSSVIDLPVQENISTDPISFTTKDPEKVKLFFDIVPTYAGSSEKIIGRAVALLSHIRPNLGSKRISLQGDVSIPIISARTMDVIGSVVFNFLIITPFSHPNMSITGNHTYWKKMTEPQIIGHRGLGKNVAARKSLQLGENTIQSFIAAANLGASYVEFDVQLTKDHVPVIYHDFLVSETGIDAPVHTLTLEQFLHISDNQNSVQSRPSSPDAARTLNQSKANGSRRQRSYSMDYAESPRHDLSDRMKHTRDFKMKGYKGNSRGNFIQAPFTTLEEMFKKLPEHIGFNIEMKYPMLHESEEQEMDTYAVELNSFVDSVLAKVYDLGSKRNVIFSSFNPDICLMLSFKQPSIPILFLTDAGTYPVGDIRASSLQEAIRFASRWNLLGVVSAADPLVLCPRLVRVVKESGLVCVSYGTLNNDPQHVKVCLTRPQPIPIIVADSNILSRPRSRKA
jgi:glycerophosphodiester phosphodiesterase